MAGMMSASIVVVVVGRVVVGIMDVTMHRAREDVGEVVVEVVVVAVMDAKIQEESIIDVRQMEDGMGEMGEGVEGVALLGHRFVGKRSSSSSHTGGDDFFFRFFILQQCFEFFLSYFMFLCRFLICYLQICVFLLYKEFVDGPPSCPNGGNSARKIRSSHFKF
jgi:hypothetical protein